MRPGARPGEPRVMVDAAVRGCAGVVPRATAGGRWVRGWRGGGESGGMGLSSPAHRGPFGFSAPAAPEACADVGSRPRPYLTPAWHDWWCGLDGRPRDCAAGVGVRGRSASCLFFLDGCPHPPSQLPPPPPPPFPACHTFPQLSGQVDAAAHERQALERTLKELSAMKPETETYKVIGKMFLLQSQAELSAQVTAELAEAVSSVESRLVRTRCGGCACRFLFLFGCCPSSLVCLGGGGTGWAQGRAAGRLGLVGVPWACAAPWRRLVGAPPAMLSVMAMGGSYPCAPH